MFVRVKTKSHFCSKIIGPLKKIKKCLYLFFPHFYCFFYFSHHSSFSCIEFNFLLIFYCSFSFKNLFFFFSFQLFILSLVNHKFSTSFLIHFQIWNISLHLLLINPEQLENAFVFFLLSLVFLLLICLCSAIIFLFSFRNHMSFSRCQLIFWISTLKINNERNKLKYGQTSIPFPEFLFLIVKWMF